MRLLPDLPSYYCFSKSIEECSSKQPIRKKIFFLSIEIELLFDSFYFRQTPLFFLPLFSCPSTLSLKVSPIKFPVLAEDWYLGT